MAHRACSATIFASFDFFQQLSSGLLGWSVRLFGDGESDSPSPDPSDLATIFLPVLRALSLEGTNQDKLLKTSLFDPLRLFYEAYDTSIDQ